MKQKIRLGLILIMILGFSAPVMAQLTLESSTFDGGGGTSTGGSFEVSGTAGQFDAGSASAGSFDLQSGFWTSENPAVPVELMRFEIASTPAGEAPVVQVASGNDAPSCRLDRPAAADPADPRRAVRQGGVPGSRPTAGTG